MIVAYRDDAFKIAKVITSDTQAGKHIIIDLFECPESKFKMELARKAMLACVKACKATLLHIHLHDFGNGGCSGVAVLAESHISIHTWPESGYIALDVFMCGKCDPKLAVPILEKHFKPNRTLLTYLNRGELP